MKSGGIASALALPISWVTGPVDRAVAVIDSSPVSKTDEAARFRRILALMILGCGVFVSAQSLGRGELPSLGQLLVVLMAVAVFMNRGGRFVRDCVLVMLAVLARMSSEISRVIFRRSSLVRGVRSSASCSVTTLTTRSERSSFASEAKSSGPSLAIQA